ncbi:MAG: O-antigen translocase [Bacteroidota bacterium]|nr:O-antigen translocase [Bacteroidota bacterium]
MINSVETTNKESYRQIFKASFLFGGVQIFNILIQIIRSKFIAVLIGPAGMGIMGLLTSTLGIIGSLTNFGLGTSAVKDIAAAQGSGNTHRIATVSTVLKRLVWITGSLGTLVAFILSPWLSELTFGNRNYTIAFIWISITLLFNQLSSGQLVILQGLRKLQYLAKANVLGSAIGLIFTLPLYYKWGVDGIVPGIITTALISLFLSWHFSRKVGIIQVKVSRIRTVAESKQMLQMGFMISLSILFSVIASYIVRIFISRFGGVEQVGLYNAGFAIINSYAGLIFSAMATDYYPRLSAVAHSNSLSKQTINQQAEIAILILAPIIIVFLVFVKWVIILLYSTKFLPVNEMIYWAALGMFFKAASWSVSFTFLAKGTSKLYFWNELITDTYLLILNIAGYYYLGLTGLGLSFAISFLIYSIQVYIICRIKFEFNFDWAFIKIFIFQFGLAICSFLILKYLIQPYAYLAGIVLVVVSSWYSFKKLDNRLGVKALLINLKDRFIQK